MARNAVRRATWAVTICYRTIARENRPNLRHVNGLHATWKNRRLSKNARLLTMPVQQIIMRHKPRFADVRNKHRYSEKKRKNIDEKYKNYSVIYAVTIAIDCIEQNLLYIYYQKLMS